MNTYIYKKAYVHADAYVYAGMLNCPAFGQSGTGIKRTNDAGSGPVLD